ncbi:hypothetical protein [Methanospirillum purgamenti]|jgi:hypothetical protein|uniref:hypothetical protein n=1 Tax=Methanospirillum purgamenti TaxID=2834276 RepID=UPI002A2467AE|nr:hypothetical protein [Methanospirillum hungatei]
MDQKFSPLGFAFGSERRIERLYGRYNGIIREIGLWRIIAIEQIYFCAEYFVLRFWCWSCGGYRTE